MIEQQQPTTQKQTHNSEYPQFYTMPVLLLDLDGTVRKTIQTESPFIQNTEDQQLNGDIEKRIWHYRDRGYFVAAVSNQGGVAMGFKKEEDVMKELAHFATLFEKYPFH